MVLLFGLVAVITAIIAVLVLGMVWENYFRVYATENMQRVADYTATALEQNYELNGGWTDSASDVPAQTSDSSVLVMAVDANGNVIYGDNRIPDDESIDGNKMVTSDIVSHGEKIGEVGAWVYNSSDLMSERDRDFLNNSYGAMIFAAVVGALLAMLIGLTVSRSLTVPIKRISATADEIKRGNLSARTKLVGKDELAQLGMTIDDMASSIENDRELEHRLTNDVAHELRTPLMAMQATMEAMVDGVLPPDAQRLEMLNSEVKRLGKLVDALLKLSRLENRSTPMNIEEVDLASIVEELVLAHQMLVEDSGLEFEYTYVPDVMVEADPDMIKQATANILSNAVRYTPEGGKISIDVSCTDTMGLISISDTGIGLSPEELKHIFSRFWRADSGRDRESGGLGVGLAIVKEIVDRHNGWVDVNSVQGEGSTFTINIPLVKEDPKKQTKKKQDKQNGRRFFVFPAKATEASKEDEVQEKPSKQKRDRPKRERTKKERSRWENPIRRNGKKPEKSEADEGTDDKRNGESDMGSDDDAGSPDDIERE